MIAAQTEVEKSGQAARVDALAARPKPSGRLRVLHVLNQLAPGGTEHALLRLIREFGTDDFEHRICALRFVDSAFAAQYGVQNQVEVAGSNQAGFQFPLLRLMRMMRAFRPHIVHTRNWGGLEAVVAARWSGVPVVIHSEHGYELDTLKSMPLRRRVFRSCAYRMADAVFTNSKDLREYHARQTWTSVNRIKVIYNGIDLRRFSSSAAARDSIRPQYGFSRDTFVVASVGRLVAIKDHSTLLQSAATMAGQGIDIGVLLVGAGPERNALEEQVKNSTALNGRVVFSGDSANVPELLSTADVFVLSSRGEGMSNTLLEAMASGLPVAASRVGGNPEVVEEGQTAFLFAPGDSKALANHLLVLQKDTALRARFGESGRRRVAETFQMERMVSEYRKLYLDQAARRQIVLDSIAEEGSLRPA